jgi:hypothetical protein
VTIGCPTLSDFIDASREPRYPGAVTIRVGEFLVKKGVLTPPQVDQIVEHGKRSGLRFGDAAVELGLVTEQKLAEIFGKNNRFDFFHLDAKYFPQETKDLLPISEILKWGALPLGSKTEYRLFRKGKILNFGLLDPGQPGVAQALETLAKQKFTSSRITRLKFFLVLADQFLGVVQTVYGLSPEQLQKERSGGKIVQMDKTLEMFVEGGTSG